MTERRVAILSLHTSPLATPGSGDSGGMNVYVGALARSLARAGVAVDVFTRRDHPSLLRSVEQEPDYRVVHVDAGPARPLPKEELTGWLDDLVDGVLEHTADEGIGYDALHAHYWLSGAVGHRLKHVLDRPLVSTFHTLARVKHDAGVDDDPHLRGHIEREVVGCSDLMVVSTHVERDELVELYGADPARVEVVSPGVDHETFAPGDAAARRAARARLGLGDRRTLLFVGRIQPLKGADLALACLAELDHHDAELVIVGGPSGRDGAGALDRLHGLAARLGVTDRVRFVPPQPHRELAAFYRAADVCLVPSLSESFGLVALEAAACGTPVVAADVGGLRCIVEHGRTGFLVGSRSPVDYAVGVALLLSDADLASELGAAAHHRSLQYAWSMTAARLRRLYADLLDRAPVTCE